MTEKQKVDSKLQSLIDILSQDVYKHSGWVERKEVAAWGAIVFYIAGLWTLFSFVVEYDNPFKFYVLSVIDIFLIFLFIIIFAFVKAQYASIYFTLAYSFAAQRTLYGLLQKQEKGEDIVLEFHGLDHYPKFIKCELQKQLSQIQPYRKRKHPTKIVWDFWTLWIRNFWTLRIRKKPEKRKLNNYSKQEAAIYSLLLLTTLGLLTYSFFRWFLENCL